MSHAAESGQAAVVAVTDAGRQAYVVETGRSSVGHLFLAPTEPGEGMRAGPVLAIRGALLSRSTTGSRGMQFTVDSAGGVEIYSVEVTVEVEPGSVPFGFEWAMGAVPEGDYLARLLVIDSSLGEDARVEWRVCLRDAAAVTARVEAAREEVARLRDASGEAMPTQARQALALAMDSLVPFPSSELPLIEADENAKFAMATASHVRAGLAFGRYTDMSQALPVSNADSARSLFAADSPFRGAIVLGTNQDAALRLAQLGFDFVPWRMTPQSGPPPVDLPAIVWLDEAGDETRARSPEELEPLQARDTVAGVSLWTAPRAPAHDAQTVEQFRNYVEGVYGDRVKLNRAWKQHLFSFDEVEFWPGIDNRAYQYDVQAFERQRVSRWLSEGIRGAEGILAPAVATLTFSDGVLMPEEARPGLDAETLVPTLPTVAVQIRGPLDDGRYAQRYPGANVLYALFRSFAPGKPLVVLQSLDYDLTDRLRMDSAAQFRTLAMESAIEGVSALAIEMPGFADAAQGSPEAVAGFAGALRDLRGARAAIATLRADPAPVAVLWSDSSKVIDSSATHLGALMKAYEGCSFSGQNAGFITERQLANGQWNGVRVLVLPEVTALTQEAFEGIESLIASGVAVIRTESGPVYDEHGRALGKSLSPGANSVLIQGEGEAHEYLDAIDELMSRGILLDTLRAITRNGFPIEGVKTRYIKSDAGEFLYVVNLRKEAVSCRLNREIGRATDVFTGRIVEFPRTLDPLDPVLLRIDAAAAVQ